MAEKSLPEHFKKIYTDIKKYVELKFDYLKLEIVEKIIEVYSRIILWAVIGVVFSFVFLFLLVALSLYLGKLWGEWYLGFLVTAGGATILLIFVILLRKVLITNPLLRIFLSIFFNFDEYEHRKTTYKKNQKSK